MRNKRQTQKPNWKVALEVRCLVELSPEDADCPNDAVRVARDIVAANPLVVTLGGVPLEVVVPSPDKPVVILPHDSHTSS